MSRLSCRPTSLFFLPTRSVFGLKAEITVGIYFGHRRYAPCYQHFSLQGLGFKLPIALGGALASSTCKDETVAWCSVEFNDQEFILLAAKLAPNILITAMLSVADPNTECLVMWNHV